MKSYHKQAEKISDDITRAYADSAKWINREVKKIFTTFTTDSGLSEKEAYKLLQTATDKKALDDIKRVLKSVKDPEKRRKLLAVVNAPAYAHRIKRLEELRNDIDIQTKKLCSLEDNVTAKHYADLANDAYAHAMYDLQKGIDISFSFAKMPASRIAEILNNNWSGRLFSERIWGKAQRINTRLKQELLVGFMTGRSYRRTAKNITEAMRVGAMEARRLVHTESTYIANSAELESYKAGGVKSFRFLATLDMRTSEICASMDGKEFDVADGEVGVNIPPLHPWCRSTTIPVIDNSVKDSLARIARDPKTGKNYKVPADMTYEQWKRSVDEVKKPALTKPGDGGRIKSENVSIISSRIDSPIEKRNTSKGNPNAVLHVGASLNNKQQNILHNLPSYDSRVTVNKKSVNMKDLSALTAHTGDEFAMFTKGKERIIVRGNKTSVNIDIEQAKELSKQGYKWSGHTHPGIDENCLISSPGDNFVLKAFGQSRSVIYNSKGRFQVFGG